MNKLKEILFLKSITGVGNARINNFYLPIIHENNGIEQLKEIVLSNEKKAGLSDVNHALESANTAYDMLLKATDYNIYTVMDPEYPEKLNALGNKRPVIIYVKGDISVLDEKNVSVIGTREPGKHTVDTEKVFVNSIIEQSERVIVSGLAAGCDTVAHKACIDAGGKTVAVLPCGFDHIFPEENKSLCEEIIASGGALISEYPPDTKASQYTFVERDAIIAALGDATLVMQCGEKSGTMHTVDAALKMKKRIGVYNPEAGAVGDYSGNRYIIESKGGFSIGNTGELKKFFELLRESESTTQPVQMTIFDLMGD